MVVNNLHCSEQTWPNFEVLVKSVQRWAAQEAQKELDMAIKQIYIVHKNLGNIKL